MTALALLICVAATPAAAATMTIPIAYRQPDVDGHPFELVWRTATTAPPFVDVSTGRSDLSTQVRLLHSPRGIHLLFTCRESMPVHLGVRREAGTNPPELADALLVRIETKAATSCFVLYSTGRSRGERLSKLGSEPIDPLSFGAAVSVDHATWWGEITIPRDLYESGETIDSLRISLQRWDWTFLGKRAVRRFLVSGGKTGHPDDRRQALAARLSREPPRVPAEGLVPLLAASDLNDPLPKARDAGRRLLAADSFDALYARIHLTQGGTVTLKATCRNKGVETRLYLVPEWRQAGEGSLIESRLPDVVAAGGGDRSVRELLLKSPAIPPVSLETPDSPVQLPLLPDHPELLLLLVKAKDGVGKTRVVIHAEGRGGTDLVDPLAFDLAVLPRFQGKARQIHGIYVPKLTDWAIQNLADFGIDHIVTSFGKAPEAMAAALAGRGMTVTSMREPPPAFQSLVTHLYGVDEPFNQSDHERCRQIFDRAHQAGLKTATAVTSRRSLRLLAGTLDRAILNLSMVPGLLRQKVPFPSGQERFYYWQLVRSDPVRHRLLGGFYLACSGFDGSLPFAYDSARSGWDDWSAEGLRPGAASYPIAGGDVLTTQFIGYAQGKIDLMAFEQARRLLERAGERTVGNAGAMTLMRIESLLTEIRRGMARPYWEILEKTPAGQLDRWRQELLRLNEIARH